MQSQHDHAVFAVRRILATAGVTGAALALAAGAALPAYADHDPGQDQGKSQGQGQSQGQGDQHAAKPESTPAAKPTTKPSAKPTAKASSHDPAGNNGTFFVKRTRDDSHPGNQPHVSCAFYLSFFGFDKGQTVSVTFTGQAPTGAGQPVATTATSTLTSTTAAGGAGNDYDGYLGVFDGSNLDLSKLGAPAKQGYHVKVDVATQQGGGHKYKVFWFSPCTGSSTTTPSGTTGTTSTAGAAGTGTGTGTGTAPATTTTTATSGSVAGGATVEGLTMTRPTTKSPSSSTPTQVLGERVTRRPSATEASHLSSLPFTGTDAALLAGLGATALGGGAALTVAGRRRRAAGGA